MERDKNNFFSSINYLRIIACLLVVANHTIYLITNNSQSSNAYPYLLYSVIVKIAVPIFFMISGALNLRKNYSYKEILGKALKRILIPLLVFSIIIYFKRNPNLEMGNILQFLKDFCTNQILFPYWFLYTLLGLYILTPLLRKCVEKLNKVDYRIFFGFCILILTVLPVLNHYNILPINSYFNIGLTTIPLLYYILGYYLYNKMEKMHLGTTILITILAVIFTMIAPFVIKYDINKGYGTTFWYDLASIPVFSLSFMFVYLFRFYGNKRLNNKLINGYIYYNCKNTLLIYLIHGLLLGHFEFVYRYLINNLHINKYISLVVYQLVFFTVLNIGLSVIRIIIEIFKEKGTKMSEKKLNGTVIVTYRCNARCTMCNRYKCPSKVDEEISIETIKKLPKMYFTNITGGEPFMREDLADVVRELYKKSDRIVISTNGFFTDRIIKLCEEFPEVGIRISIEGLEQTNNEIRGLPDGFNRGYSTLKKLVEMKHPDVGFGMTVQDRNAKDLVALYDLSNELNMEFATASLHNSFYFVEAKNIIKDRPMVAQEFENLVNKLLASKSPKKWFRAYFNHGLINYIYGQKRLLPCDMAFDTFFIDPYGDVMPCNGTKCKEVMGNLNEQSWDELWNSEQAEKVRNIVRHCTRQCWMIGSVSPAMHKYIWVPMWWVIRHKLKFWTKKKYSMYENKIVRQYRDGKVTKEDLDKLSTCDFNAKIENGLSEASKEQLKNKTGEEIVDEDIKRQMEK